MQLSEQQIAINLLSPSSDAVVSFTVNLPFVFSYLQKHVTTFKIVKPEEAMRKITNCELSVEFAETNGRKVYLIVVRQVKKVLI